MSTAFGVAPDSSGQGCDAMTHRRVIASQWENTGIVSGLEVSGRQDLRYGVSPGVAVCSMGDADGMSIAWWDGAGSPYTEDQVSAGDSAYPRIDAVYMIAHTGQPDNLVHVKAAQGEPSASPVPPRVEAGGQVLAYMMLPAGATSTAAAARWGDVDYAVPYGARMGRLGYGRNTSTVVQDWTSKWWSQAPVTTLMMPTDRLVTVRFTFRASVDGEQVGSFYAMPVVDGVEMGDGNDECQVSYVWARQHVEWSLVLSGGASHTVDVKAKPNLGRPRFTWRGLRTVEVVDEGVVR
ncbi:hypothetical protein J3U01_08605 [Bifidobacterium sp. B4107]|uniref:hypothetical protein n=1 Tax=unclassified Bifidobacterium TaxID=2608897 RepID=UPI00226B2B89|nr:MULTISPECIES: hypothetical protein [unclassified Bifidobacterium]MCX8648459.1 hypothetical protein [Bifidobacterium sp. B4107]MCX8652549.1 hypothetical protein [Bifidobacterium sp. B4111]MCX8659087.1 hypothetical protein [Bifidobacterium sp. B4114]